MLNLCNRLARWALLPLLLALLGACASGRYTADGRVYHCVATAQPEAGPNQRAKRYPLEVLEYGDYSRSNKQTVGHDGYCNLMTLPKTAYLRYRLDGRIIEKTFDLSSLTPRQVSSHTVEFYVKEDQVEVRLIRTIPNTMGRTTEEIITRQ